VKVYSYVRKGIDLEVVEIEISLVPGLPAFHLIGLPDAAIKESVLRIKSALRHQGFRLPQREQVLIHLKPSHERKTSQGLDLAIAAAYLWKTEQLPYQFNERGMKKIFLYGEVSLEGAVSAPQDLELLEAVEDEALVITGESESSYDFHHGRVSSLQDLATIKWCEPRFDSAAGSPSELGLKYEDYEFSEPLAQLMMVAAAGEHNVFVAGPAGTGKTTFSETLHALLRLPTRGEQRKIEKIARVTGQEVCGRPFIAPHHSVTDIALLGGGVPPRPGEITRAQHGTLVLDEFLEFENHVKEALREPIEKHEITVSRHNGRMTFPADFLLIGTSNLCPCGDYVPNKPTTCERSATYCKSYYQRLSGPLLDRFEIISFSHVWKLRKSDKNSDKKKVVRLSEVRARVQTAQAYALASRGQSKMNGRLTLKECEETLAPFVRTHLMPEVTSHRRNLALCRVARTFADLDGAKEVTGQHIERAKNLTIQPFREMKEAWR